MISTSIVSHSWIAQLSPYEDIDLVTDEFLPRTPKTLYLHTTKEWFSDTDALSLNVGRQWKRVLMAEADEKQGPKNTSCAYFYIDGKSTVGRNYSDTSQWIADDIVKENFD